MTALLLTPLAGLRGATPTHVSDAGQAGRVLVGVNYFAGWWDELPNKWHGNGWTKSEADWRPRYPDRVPLLGSYNDQATMDREIVAAAEHGVDFFSILWYFSPSGSKQEPISRLLDRGLVNFQQSPNSPRMKFLIEYCNAPEFSATNDAQWAECIKVWVVAMKHPSYLRVGGRLVFKVHSAEQFLRTHDNDLPRCRRRLDDLRHAVRAAGSGEMLIGGGIMSRSQIKPSHPVATLFDFTATYMSIPEVEVGEAEHPFSSLAQESRSARAFHATDPIPWVPYLAAGWNPRPWTHAGADANHRRFFAFPTREEWAAELRQIQDDFRRFPSLGLPLPDGGRQPIFTIYAWNEFGEGGIVAPTRGEQYRKLDAIRDVFAHAPPATPASPPSAGQ